MIIKYKRNDLINILFVSLMIMIFTLFFQIKIYSQPLANGKSKFLGGATVTPIWSGMDKYLNQVTPGNDGKWGSVEPNQGQFNWNNLDVIYNYAVERGFPFKLHTFVWGSQQPSWITSLDSAGQRAAVENWIRSAGQRYPKMDMVDVVNEPIRAPAPYRNAIGGAGVTGYDWIITAFQWARQYCAPNVKLILNEYNILSSSSQTTTYLTIINLLKDRGLIDGIGIQGHYFEFRSRIDGTEPPDYIYDTTTIKNNLNRLTATGIPVYITEFDVDEPIDANQLASYKVYFPMLWNNPGVKGITLWGYVASDIWSAHPYTYLIRSDGTERPALTWLRNFLANGNYQSYQSGDWNDVNTWSKHNGTTWVHPPVSVPTINDDAVTILNGHIVTAAPSDTMCKLTVAEGGTLIINPGTEFIVRRGTTTLAGMTINGSLWNYGTIKSDTMTSIIFGTNGTYHHLQDGGIVPIASWVSGSNCKFEYIKTSLPLNLNQNFANFIWNCTQQSADISLFWNNNTINGNCVIQSTGTGQLELCSPSEGESSYVTIVGDLIQTDGKFSANGSDASNTSVVINHKGNLNINGGDFAISRGTQNGNGTTIWNLSNGNLNISNSTIRNLSTNPSGARILFSKVGTQNLTIATNNNILSLPIEVKSGTTLNAGTSEVNGSGTFVLSKGATLICSHPGGLDGFLKTTGSISLSKSATYIFNGSTTQITGSLLPDTIKVLTINNSAGVNLTNSTLVDSIVNMQNGMLTLAGGQLAYGENASIAYLGTTARSTSNAEFPAINGPRNVLIPNSAGITLHESRSILGYLNLFSNSKFILGNNDFSASSVMNTTNRYYIITQGSGQLKLPANGSPVLYPIGTKVGYAPLVIKHSNCPTTVGASVMDDSSSITFGGRVLARWNISSSQNNDLNDSIQFGWVYAFIEGALGNNWNKVKIFRMTANDTSEAGIGNYAYQTSNSVFSVSRNGISSLGTFCIGMNANITDVQINAGITIPKEFGLSQNYPNPFNPTTVINYQLSVSSDVSLKIYNILGCEVSTLVYGKKEAGSYTTTFDASHLSSGTYFAKLTALPSDGQKPFIQVRKMLLLK